MNIIFPKNLLIIDFETYLGDGLDNAEPLQIGTLLLDKETLREKESYASFIRAESALPTDWLERKGYSSEQFSGDAQSREIIAQEFMELFGDDYLLASWTTELDMRMFRTVMYAINLGEKDFDYHVYDIWPLAFTYLLERGYDGSWKSEDIFREFGLPSRDKTHDALEDCRYAAHVLRKVLEARD